MGDSVDAKDVLRLQLEAAEADVEEGVIGIHEAPRAVGTQGVSVGVFWTGKGATDAGIVLEGTC